MTFKEALAGFVLRAKADINDAYEKGKVQGGDGWYDAFWDGFQDNGMRSNYAMAFAYAWDDEAFRPKYDIVATNAGNIFNGSRITSLKGKLDELGRTLDVSGSTTLLQMFQNAAIKDVPILDGSKATTITQLFGSSMVETVEKLILSDKLKADGINSAFSKAESLTHIIFEGVLMVTGLDLHWSTLLDAESYDSLMNILSPSTTGMSVTLPAYSIVQSVFDNKYGAGSWDALVASKSNWTIAYN